MGNFILKESEKPLVLIGGGIGITPMLAMAYGAKSQDRKIKLIYSMANSKYHSFKEELDKLCKNNKNIELIVIYTRPLESDQINIDYDKAGRIDKEWMDENLTKDADFYFCGPVEFMKSIYKNLVSMGVEQDHINYEIFGPGTDITK